MIFWILFGVLLLISACIVVERLTYWRRQNVPFIPIKWPYIFGNITSEKHQSLHFVDFYRNHRANHPIIGINIFMNNAVLICDLELVGRILGADFQLYFPNRGMFSNPEVDPLSAILGTLDDDVWKSLRQRLTPAFTISKMKSMFPTMQTVGAGLVTGLNEIIATENVVEFRDLFSRFATDVIGSVAFGIECNTLCSRAEFRKMTKKAMQPHLKFPLNLIPNAWPGLAKVLRMRKHTKVVSDFFVDSVEQIIQYRKTNVEERNDFMQLLIDAKLKTNEIAALAFDLLSAGYADSTSTLAYCLYELALPENQHIQRQARNEIQTVLEQNDGQLTYDSLAQMVYCQQIINGRFKMDLRQLIRFD